MTAAAGASHPYGPALAPSFYDRDVVTVARHLIGCVLVHGETAGRIVETEAYHQDEPACHAYVGPTPRAATLFKGPGIAYVYFSYGIHTLFNAVCESTGVGAAVLVRALEPLCGEELMRARRGRDPLTDLCSGPGKLTQALAIELSHNERPLDRGPVTIHARMPLEHAPAIAERTRIGITKATELPWRFVEVGNAHVSRP